MQRDRAVAVERIAADIDLFGVGGDHLARHLADDLQHAAVVIDGVGGVRAGRNRRRRWPREIVFLKPRDLLQVEVVEKEQNVVVIEEKIRHEETPRRINCKLEISNCKLQIERLFSFPGRSLGTRTTSLTPHPYFFSLIALIIIGSTCF